MREGIKPEVNHDGEITALCRDDCQHRNVDDDNNWFCGWSGLRDGCYCLPWYENRIEELEAKNTDLDAQFTESLVEGVRRLGRIKMQAERYEKLKGCFNRAISIIIADDWCPPSSNENRCAKIKDVGIVCRMCRAEYIGGEGLEINPKT